MRIDNYARQVGRRSGYDWYEWRVFIDEPPEALARIERVEYRLHPTFPNPVRVETDSSDQFALYSNGWGVFEIGITVHYKDGSSEFTTYELDFDKEWPRDVVFEPRDG